MEFVKTWTECVNDLTEVYVPFQQLAPVRDEWTFASKRYIYKSLVPVSSVDLLNGWVESSEPPKFVGSFFMRENLEDGKGIYEVIPMSLIKGTIVVKRFVERTYYRVGADKDQLNDPKDQYRYHVEFGTCAPVQDPDFIYFPEV